MRFELFIAGRYLRAKRRQALVGVVTVLSVLGITAGVASLIVALAITAGMQHDLEARLLGATSHVELMRVQGDGIRNWQALTQRLQGERGVVAASPVIYGQVLVSRGSHAGGALVKGIVPADERRVSDLLKTVQLGNASALDARQQVCAAGCNDATMPPILLGKDLAEQLGAGIGDVVLVTSPQGELTPVGLVPRYQRFTVAGIFHSGFYEYDSSWAFIAMPDAQHLFGEPDIVSAINFRLSDPNAAHQVGRELEQAAGTGFMTTTWMEQNQELFRALKLEQVVTFVVLALIVLVAALNILIALTMMVMEKSRDIAVLLAMGVEQSQIQRIFLLQGLMVGLVGTALGLALGYATAWAGGHYHFIHLSAEVYSLDYVPFEPRAMHGVIVGAVALAVSLLATLYPARSAARVRPAEALRYE